MWKVITMVQVTPERPDGLRASDADRERVAAELGRAQTEGRLDLVEYDERLQAAWAARTYGELELVTADLPAARVEAPATAPVPAAAACGRGRGQRGAVAAWAYASSINLVIWAVVSIASTSWVYPWWIWVAGPWGAVLLAGWVAGRVSGSGTSRDRR